MASEVELEGRNEGGGGGREGGGGESLRNSTFGICMYACSGKTTG